MDAMQKLLRWGRVDFSQDYSGRDAAQALFEQAKAAGLNVTLQGSRSAVWVVEDQDSFHARVAAELMV